jgi:hypothetical protein
MELLTEEIRNRIPELTAQGELDDPVVYVKFFTPASNRTWLATEGEPVLDERGEEMDFEFFGRIHGHDVHWGSWTLKELLSVKDSSGMLNVTRDSHFDPKPISELDDAENRA